MCKLYAVVEIENQRNAELFTRKAIPEITKTDNHGLGVMRLGENGIHGQRWLEPPTVMRKKKSKIMTRYEKALRGQYNEFGVPSRNLQAIAVHGRFATCAKTMENVHPFYKADTALMHNGIISNHEQYKKDVSTCDSEALLSQYNDFGVKRNSRLLSKAMDGVGGYFAAIVFNENGVIDIWRDDFATLFLGHVRGVGVVIATTKEIITKTARRCRMTLDGVDEILPFTNLRWRNGVSPQISTFEVKKPTIITSSKFDWKEYEKERESREGTLYSKEDREKWWNTEPWDDNDEKSVMAWQKERGVDIIKQDDESAWAHNTDSDDDADAKALEKLYDETTRREAKNG